MSKAIYFFSKNDRYFQFSNFSGFGFKLDGVYWPTMEHYFQAMKFVGTQHSERIYNAGSPKQAKDLGQSRSTPIRNDWETVKEQIMFRGLQKKFENTELKKLLLSTGEKELIENSPFDKYWGIGKNGKGKNRLGLLLMKLRNELINK